MPRRGYNDNVISNRGAHRKQVFGVFRKADAPNRGADPSTRNKKDKEKQHEKKLIAASMAAAMTLSLAACGGSGASSTASAGDTTSTAASTEAASGDEQINLRMAWWGSQDRHDKTIAAIELYESLNPNVKIEYEYYSFDDYFTKLKTLVASDQVWDVFQMGGNFPMYIDKICPLDDYIASGVVDTSGITDANLKITQDTEGHQLGLSNGLNSYGIAYDPAMFAEAGVAEPTDDWTWDDYANAANTIHDKLGIYGCSSMLSSEFIAGCSVYISQYGNVGENSFFNLDLTGMGFDDAQMLTPYIQMRADSIKNGAYPTRALPLRSPTLRTTSLSPAKLP